MRNTTALALRGSLVTLTSSASAFLGNWLLTRTSHITETFGFLEDVPVFVLPVLKHILYDVSTQGQVVNLGVELSSFASVFSGLEIEDGNLHCLAERTRRPRLVDH